jgi:Cu2+-exporting ATPase
VSFEGPEWVKPLAAAVEQHSSHPIAAAIRKLGVAPQPAEDVSSEIGGGIEATVAGRRVALGSRRFIEARVHGVVPNRWREAGDFDATPVHVAVDGEHVAIILVGDEMRADAARAVHHLRLRGWHVELLSGDAHDVTVAVGRRLGLSESHCTGEASPEQKLEHVRRRMANGDVVMVGDGVNDAAAMAAATLGVSVHGGAEACMRTADVFVAKPGLGPLVELMDGARRTMHVIRRNMAFALAYNAAGASLAMAGLLHPLLAAVLMPASSITVVMASWRSRTFGSDT